MAAAIVQQRVYQRGTVDWSSGVGGVVFTFTAPCVVGNLIEVAVVIGANNRTVASMDDSSTTTYTLQERIQGTTGTLEVWRGIAAGTDPGVNITITLSGNTGDSGAVFLTEISGLNTDQSTAVDNENDVATPGTTHDTGSVTPPTANGYCAYIQDRTSGNWTDDSSFTYASGTQAAGCPYGYILNNGSASEGNNTSEDPELSTSLIWAWAGAGVAPTAPDIDDVNTNEEIELDSTGNIATGTNFDLGTIAIQQDDGPCDLPVNSDDDTEIDFDCPSTGSAPRPKYGAATLIVTNADDEEGSIAVTIVPASDVDFVTLTSVNADSDYRITAIPDLEAGYQLEWSNVVGGTIADVVVAADATFSVEIGVESFDVRAWNSNTALWGAIGTQTISQEFTTAAEQPRDGRRRGMLNMIWGRG